MSCDSCPLKNAGLSIECASTSKPHPRYCQLSSSGNHYDERIISESLRIHNEMAEREGFPPLKTQALNLGKSLVGWIKDGLKLAPDNIKLERLSICKECDRHRDGRCLECGCYLTKKCSLASSECPLGKWSAFQNPEPSGCGCKSHGR